MRLKKSLTTSISLLVFLALVFQANLVNSQNSRLAKYSKASVRQFALTGDPGEFELNASGEGVQTDKPRPEKNAPCLVATFVTGAGTTGGSVRLLSVSEFSFGYPKEIIRRDIQRAQIVAAQKSREFTLLGLKPSGVS